jgi:hypothetical protein
MVNVTDPKWRVIHEVNIKTPFLIADRWGFFILLEDCFFQSDPDLTGITEEGRTRGLLRKGGMIPFRKREPGEISWNLSIRFRDCIWRRGWDSNPRAPLSTGQVDFESTPLRPLRYLSVMPYSWAKPDGNGKNLAAVAGILFP